MKTSSQKERTRTSESREAMAKHVLRSRKKGSKFKSYIEACRRPADEESSHRSNYVVGKIRNLLKNKSNMHPSIGKTLERLIKVCKNTKLIDCIDELGRIALWEGVWIREPEDWKPTSKNSYKQLSSFVRHLFAKYDIPKFMDSAWHSNNTHQEEWFILLGQGENIRKQRNLPFPMTKKMAHHFLQAPDTCTIPQAFRWGEIQSLGGNKRIFDGVMSTRLANNNAESHFWRAVIQFFIDNPLLDIAQYGPVCDYIYERKYNPRGYQVVDGMPVNLGPIQPNFSMAGRNPETLLREVNQWHTELGRRGSRNAPVKWESCGIPGYEKKVNKGKTVYTITELTTSKELSSEGRVMRNCVSSYSASCSRGGSAIYSLRETSQMGIRHIATIELDIKQLQISQARGKANAYPNLSVINLIKTWATERKLSLSTYL